MHRIRSNIFPRVASCCCMLHKTKGIYQQLKPYAKTGKFPLLQMGLEPLTHTLRRLVLKMKAKSRVVAKTSLGYYLPNPSD